MESSISAGDLRLGASVVDSTGEQVGTVNEVEGHPSAQKGSDASLFMGVVDGGFMGIGGSHLYIPISEVQEVKAGPTVVLRCTASEAKQQYADKPS